MASASSRSRSVAVVGACVAALLVLACSAIAAAPDALLAPAHASASAAVVQHALSIAKQVPPELNARVFANVQRNEGGSPSTSAQDVPVQAYVNRVERLRSIRAARSAAVHRLHEHRSFLGAINAGKLLDQFE